MLNKKDNLIIFVLVLLIISLAVFVMTKDNNLNEYNNQKINDDKKLNINNNTNQNQNTNQQVAITIDETDVSNWQTFKGRDINFTFEYPKEWTYLIKKYEFGPKRIIFNSEIRENEMIIEIPIPAVGLETWVSVETKIYKTNDINTDLLLTYMKSRYKDEKLLFNILEWQKGINGDKLQKGFKKWDNNSTWLYIIRYDEKYDKYYRNIIEKIANSFKFIY